MLDLMVLLSTFLWHALIAACFGDGWLAYLRVLALPTRGVLLKAFCRATILMTYSVPGFRPKNKQQIHDKTL